jgi:hypothetical protein
MAAGQTVTQEAVEKSLRYWGEMFEMIVEMQKRLFALIEEQMSEVPGAKEAKAAMAMMPDLTGAESDQGDAGSDVFGRIGVRIDAARDGRFHARGAAICARAQALIATRLERLSG